MNPKRFDCVEMKRRGALEVYERTKDMTIDEELDYWRRRTDELRRQFVSVQSVGEEPPRSASAANA